MGRHCRQREQQVQRHSGTKQLMCQRNGQEFKVWWGSRGDEAGEAFGVQITKGFEYHAKKLRPFLPAMGSY